jgi:hypothetical protein
MEPKPILGFVFEKPNLDEPEPNKKRYNFTGWNY